jgi:hypothetical protein
MTLSNGEHKLSPRYRLASTVPIMMAVAFAVTTFILCYLTALSVESPRCAGQAVLLGYRSGFWDFLAFPLLSLFSLIPIVKSRNSQQIADILANYDLPVFEFASIRISFGMLLVYSTLFGFCCFRRAYDRGFRRALLGNFKLLPFGGC